MDDLGPGQIELKVHGLVTEDHGRVPARVFANKLKQFVMALEAADVFANGKTTHTYLLSSMHMSQPTAVLTEVVAHSYGGAPSSAYPVFRHAIETIQASTQDYGELGTVIQKVNMLATGADTQFGFAEVRDSKSNVVRIDSFLKGRAFDVRWKVPNPWFSGISYGSFDGVLRYVDTRGELPQIKLLLSAGGKEIDCICRRDDIETIGDAIEKRVRIFGKAIYAANQPLPVRVEVTCIEAVGDPADFTRWNGSFHPFEQDGWNEDGVSEA